MPATGLYGNLCAYSLRYGATITKHSLGVIFKRKEGEKKEWCIYAYVTSAPSQ